MMSDPRTPAPFLNGSPQIKQSSLGTPRITRRRLSMNVSLSDENSPYEYGHHAGSTQLAPRVRVPLAERDPNIQAPHEKLLPAAEKGNVAPPFSCHHRPSSLPSLVSQDKGSKAKRNLYTQISSPMGRMSLMSPGSSLGSEQSSSRPSSTTSLNDGFFPVFDQMEEPLPSAAVSSLISAPFPSPMTNRISEKNDVARPTPIRPWSCRQVEPRDSGGKEPTSGARRGSLKRSSPMSQPDLVRQKRHCPLPFGSKDSPSSTFLRSQSYCGPSLSISPNSPIGDVSKQYALPLVKKASVSDLKYISPDTLNRLLEGKFSGQVDRYTILDCRFPYEYEGGHIRGAKNTWTQEGLLECLFSEPLHHPQEGHREIFIFHCEFSSKRGPKMSRFLRKTDRDKNGMSFPKLFYPELYLLDGGYKAFFAKHSEMCEPQSYCCMEDENYLEELKKCKVRSQSWHGDQGSTVKRRHRHSEH